MNKLELASRLARESRRSHAKAADEVDNLVYNLLKDLKHSAKSVLCPDKRSRPAQKNTEKKIEKDKR